MDKLKKILIEASPEAVFNSWAKPGEIIRWFIAQAEYTTPRGNIRGKDEIIGVGDTYDWRWHQILDIGGEILAVEPGKMLQFTFGEQQENPEERIIVTVRVSQYDAKTTLLELHQENMANTLEAHSDWHLSCNLGWSFFITNLKAFLEHGADLREHTEERAELSRANTH